MKFTYLLKIIMKPRNILFIHRQYSQHKHPFYRTINVIRNDIPYFNKESESFYPEHADVLIIGGGILGSSIAYSLKTRAGKGLSVVVLEKDYKFSGATQNLHFGGVTQHFSLIENIQLSQFTAEFLRNIKERLNKDVDVQYHPHGNLVVADEKYADLLEHNVTLQKENGIRNELLSPEKIKQRYPWININGIKLGSIGSEYEGWFNPWSLQKGLMLKAQELGSIYVNAEATSFNTQLQRDMFMEGITPGTYKKLTSVSYKTSEGEEKSIKFAMCVLATGSSSGQLAKLANIGTGDNLLSIPLPIGSRKTRVYSIKSKDGSNLGLDTPLFRDVNGLWMRRNGLDNNYLCGYTPLIYKKNEFDDLSNEENFKMVVQPALAHRIPTFDNAKVITSNTEYCDYNTFDESGILGPHPYYTNMFIAAGFGSLGMEHAPGIGRAITELLIDNRYVTIDMTRFCFDRLFTDNPIVEVNSY